ncbi:type II/IV secretion system family protein, partial [Vibrio parahaemolyticus V-223/04]
LPTPRINKLKMISALPLVYRLSWCWRIFANSVQQFDAYMVVH